MNIIRNDKVVLIKPMEALQTVGDTFEVANITETAVVIRNATTKIAVGAVDIKIFDEYFKKPEEVKSWTPWQRLTDGQGGVIGFYRTNLKKVQVETAQKVRAEATCNKCDEFNLHFGLSLAWLRAENKTLKRVKTEYENILRNIDGNIRHNENLADQMIKSMYQGKQ